jgi:hypothetical protein
MVTCLICQKELMHVYSFKLHLGSNKCLKVTNDLYYEIDLILQKIQNDNYIKIKREDEYNRLNILYTRFILYKRVNHINPTLYSLSLLPDDETVQNQLVYEYRKKWLQYCEQWDRSKSPHTRDSERIMQQTTKLCERYLGWNGGTVNRSKFDELYDN